jgi:hypothetical protein
MPQVYPRSVDIHVVSVRGKNPAAPLPSSDVDEDASGGRSPPRAPSPPPQPARPASPPAEEEPGSDSASDEPASDTEPAEESELPSDEEEVESSAGSDLADWEGRVHSLEVWLPRGQIEVAARLAFAYVSPAEVCASVAPFIRAAIASVFPQISVELLPSSRGAMLLRFAMPALRELVRDASPINFQGARLSLERPQETPNRFFRSPSWLAQVAVTDYPPEHWNAEHIRRSFSGFCNVVEIDPACLTSFDFSPLRLVLEVNHRLKIPSELWVDADDLVLGGSIVSIMPVRVRPRVNQLGEDGSLIPVFEPPPPIQQQQLLPLGLPGLLPQQAQQGPGASLRAGPASALSAPHAGLLQLAALHALSQLATSRATSPSPGSTDLAPPPLASPPSPAPAAEDATVPLRRGRRPGPRAATPATTRRQSSRLAAKAGGNFVDATDKAVKLKALQNALAPCSSKLKTVVEQGNIIAKAKNPLSAADIRKLVTASGLCVAASTVGAPPVNAP